MKINLCSLLLISVAETTMAAAAAVAMTTVVMLGFLVEFSIGAGEVYKVGDSLGWTIMGNPNYTAWAQSKTFEVGDVICKGITVFEYNKQFHNVMEVTKSDYKSCNAGSPLATYTSGNDSVAIKRKGHYFFLCGVPDHCRIGQKLDIRIPKLLVDNIPPSVSGTSALPTPPSPASNLGHCNGRRVRLSPVVVLVMAVFGVGLV